MQDTSVYIHFPWCLQKCPYCDFATKPITWPAVPHADYADAVLRELELRAPSLSHRRLASVFFGGGTPSLWEPRELGRVLAGIRAAFSSEVDDLEITIECNPSSLKPGRALEYRDAGLNRFSVGVQSLDSERLKFLGRLHDRDMALEAVVGAMATGCRVSADLMFGNPGQSPEAFLSEARVILDRGLSHVSAYALTIEQGTQFGALAKKGKLPLAKDDDVADTLMRAHELFAGYGLSHYEVSNYAKPGYESVHNAHYWSGGDYLGLGAAAVGCLSEPSKNARRYRNHPDAATYSSAQALETTEESEEFLSPNDRVNEALMLGLRTARGVNLARVAESTGVDLLASRTREIERARERGDVTADGGVLRVPLAKWLHLDSIVARLFA